MAVCVLVLGAFPIFFTLKVIVIDNPTCNGFGASIDTLPMTAKSDWDLAVKAKARSVIVRKKLHLMFPNLV